ncbi:hypothetical protein ACVIM8_001605 [Bradyrhizobium sp. USDA 4529]
MWNPAIRAGGEAGPNVAESVRLQARALRLNHHFMRSEIGMRPASIYGSDHTAAGTLDADYEKLGGWSLCAPYSQDGMGRLPSDNAPFNKVTEGLAGAPPDMRRAGTSFARISYAKACEIALIRKRAFGTFGRSVAGHRTTSPVRSESSKAR